MLLSELVRVLQGYNEHMGGDPNSMLSFVDCMRTCSGR